MRRPTLNPVLARELTERWRGRRAVATLTAYLAVLAGLAYALYRIGRSVLVASSGFAPDLAGGGGPVLGRFLVEGLLCFILVGVLFVAPGYAATQIAGERERRTLPLLQLTLLRPWEIVAGKLGAAVAWLVLLVVAAVPVGAVAFFLGGVAPSDLLAGLAFLLLIAVCIAGMGLGVSSVVRRTTAAVVVTYGIVLLLVVGTLFAGLAEFIGRSTQGLEERTPIALYANPFFGLSDAADAVPPDGAAGARLPSPLGLAASAHPDRFAERRGARGMAVADPAGPAAGAPGPRVLAQDVDEGWLPVWAWTAGLHVLLGAGGLLLATRRLARVEGEAPARRRGKRGVS